MSTFFNVTLFPSPSLGNERENGTVIPAKAGIHLAGEAMAGSNKISCVDLWIPAFAGMTTRRIIDVTKLSGSFPSSCLGMHIHTPKQELGNEKKSWLMAQDDHVGLRKLSQACPGPTYMGGIQ